MRVQSFDGGQRTLDLMPAPGLGRQASFDASGFITAAKLRVLMVNDDTPAQAMGLQAGDVVVSYNGEFLTSWPDFIQHNYGGCTQCSHH